MRLEIGTAWCRKAADNWTRLPGSDEDEASLADVVLRVDGQPLLRTLDNSTGQVRHGAHLSAYRLAEWLIWNWWRLRWEPAHRDPQRDRNIAWRRAHELVSIGGGWLWPSVKVRSDGLRIVLASESSPYADTEPLRYVTERNAVVSAEAFESGVDEFVTRVLARLSECSLAETGLETAWEDLRRERQDSQATAYRRIEASLGHDVDEADPTQVERIIADGEALGRDAMTEVAADRFLTAADMRNEARRVGFDSGAGDSAPVLETPWDGRADRPAWKVGVEGARALRHREAVGDDAVSDAWLATLCAVESRALDGTDRGTLAFALHENGGARRVVFRSGRPTGRRFEAARLLGDRVLAHSEDPLRPVTGASTYRQKMQRAFAAEFLCPVRSLVDFLAQDLSDESRDAAADHFGVSPLAVTHILENNELIGRDEVRDLDP